ncbi:Crp/Fnr family transcriptional regulator [Rhodosalinus sediminis]|uniref:Crp/Fnr family transcriptional regulator n=2 Tax=Rhodosalinus TaxID=2047740 RepID=A0A3D9BJR6_9RHOB|nr:Crp/Fnr family transcriptional regulator [Rhodosalinus sediminis]REC53769.1 Crp/Fnr family transcriptional regulator [Rhodosalinus sediminis]
MTGVRLMPLSGCGSCPHHLAGICNLGALDRVRRVTLAPETVLFHQGDRTQRVGVLRSGYMRMVRFSAEGRRIGLGISRPGDMIGALPGRRIAHELEAATEVTLCMTDPATLERGTARLPALRRQMLVSTGEQLARVQEQIWLRGRLSSRERIIAFLVRAADYLPAWPQPDGSVIVDIPLPRRDWAGITDTAVETVSRTVSSLAAQGEVETLGRGRYRLANPARLARLARIGGDEDAAA